MGDLNSQSTPVTFSGNSLFRNYNFGVKNHCFTVQNRVDNYGPTTPVTDCTSSCPSSYGGQFDASDVTNGSDNDLSVTPYSDNDLEDYQNGVSAADKVVVIRHINDIQYITDPYKMVAADCNHNGEIDEEDSDQIHDLILEDIIFTRNSWEWFNQKEVIDNYGSFQSDPYSWTLTDRWSGHIFWLNVSTSTLTSGTTQPQFFYYTSTKVGEIDSLDSPNDWACGSYLKNEDVQFNSIKGNNGSAGLGKLKPGTKFTLYFKTELKPDSIAYFQLPLFVDYDYVTIKNVETCSDLDIQFRIKKDKNEFIAIYVVKDVHQQKSNCSENLMALEFELTRETSKLGNVISINPKKKLEAGTLDFQNLNPYIEIEEVRPPTTEYFIMSDMLYYTGEESKFIEIQNLNISGHIIGSQKVVLNPGINEIYLLKKATELSIIRIIDNNKTYFIKMVK